MTTLEKILQEIDYAITENMECIYDEDGDRHFCLDSEFARYILKGIIENHMSEAETTRQSRDNDGWIPCSDRVPEESLNSVIGWDEYRERCCFVQYYNGRWILGNDTEPVKIIAWRPLPEPYKQKVESFKDGE